MSKMFARRKRMKIESELFSSRKANERRIEENETTTTTKNDSIM